MLTSISPLGERARAQRWSVTAAAYVLGSLLGGLVVGAAVGLLGSVVAVATGDPSAVVVAGVAAVVLLLAAVADATGLTRVLPPRRRQVDEDWLPAYRGWVYGLGFGVQLGAGLTTVVTSASTYAALALAGVSASPVAGAVVGATFGLVRALPLLALRRVTTTARLVASQRRLAALARPAATGVVVVLLVAAAVSAVLALTLGPADAASALPGPVETTGASA